MFRLRMEAMNRQGKKTNLTCGHAVRSSEDNKKSRDEVAELVGKSGGTVSRYIRLTYLIPQLIELIDNSKLPLSVGADFSYLAVEEEGGSTGIYILMIIAILGVAGVGYYLRFTSRKKKTILTLTTATVIKYTAL